MSILDHGVPLSPLVKWSGGKEAEMVSFSHHFPIEYERFIEPFVGGGAVFFKLNFLKQNVIADVHEELINFYIKIKEGCGQQIYNIVSAFGLDESTYYFVRDKYNPANDVEKAARFIYLRRTAFRGMLRYNRKGKFNIPWGRYNTVNFKDIASYTYKALLEKTDIRLASFEQIFAEFNSKDNFVFLDPPYDSTFTDYGYCSFGKKDHLKLCSVFKSTRNKCLLVIGDTYFIRNLYRDYIVETYHKKYKFRIHSGRVGSEIDNTHLVIKNYE